MNKALLLDRDGVINHDPGYTHKIESFVFNEGIFELCKGFAQAGFQIFVITNQAGIAKGYYSELDFLKLTDWMQQRFLDKGINIAKVYYCPFHPEASIAAYKKDSFDRKPNPGMILQAKKEFSLELSRSVLIGDKAHDIQAGIAAGVGKNIIIGDEFHLASLRFNNIKEVSIARIWEDL